jgi:hypothetical protein
MIEDTFLKLKSNLELSQTFQDTISRQYGAVSSVIQNNHADVKKVRLIGSVGRKTRIPPPPGSNADFDIDMLVVLGTFYNWLTDGSGITPAKAMDSVQEAVKQAERYGKKNPERDNPTVTFTYENGVKVELVPAYIDSIGKRMNGEEYTPKGRAYWVPTRTGWQLADYDHEAEQITAANAASKGMLIPAVKMLKAAKREHFPSMKSYHLEVIAANKIPGIVAELEGKGLTPTYPLIIAYFLYRLRSYVGQSWNIAGSLSPSLQIDANARDEFIGKAAWIEEQMNAAVGSQTDRDKHLVWKNIFNDWMPMS